MVKLALAVVAAVLLHVVASQPLGLEVEIKLKVSNGKEELDANPLELVEVEHEVVEPDCPIYNTDLDGNDIDGISLGIPNVESWSDCGEICKRVKNCLFWTYKPHESQCYLKTSDMGLRREYGVYSGNRDCPTPPMTD